MFRQASRELAAWSVGAGLWQWTTSGRRRRNSLINRTNVCGKRRLSQNQDSNAFSNELFSESAKIAASNYRDIMSTFSLKAAELSYKNLRSAHLKTVDNVE